MTLIEDDFRADILRSATNCESSAFIQNFGKTKVSESQVSIVPNQQVLWLQISENNVHAVQVLEAAGDGGSVKPALIGCERFDRPHIGEELPSIDELDDQIQKF